MEHVKIPQIVKKVAETIVEGKYTAEELIQNPSLLLESTDTIKYILFINRSNLIEKETFEDLIDMDDKWACDNFDKVKPVLYGKIGDEYKGVEFYEFPDEQRTNPTLIKLIEETNRIASQIKDPKHRMMKMFRDMKVVELPSHGFWTIKKSNTVGVSESVLFWY